MSNTSEGELNESDLMDDPIELFDTWFKVAKTTGLNDPNAMCLSTIDEVGVPDSRMVLLKGFDKRGFVFFTNSQSNKGRSILKTPNVALNMFWDPLGRQIRIQGEVEIVSSEESDDYFSSRRRESQLGAWASLQSQELDSRQILEGRLQEFSLSFPEAVPRPPHWYGFRVKPGKIEFWQNRKDRLHDRFVYRLLDGDWKVQRLYP